MGARECCLALAALHTGLAVWAAARQHGLPWWLCAPLLFLVALLTLHSAPPRPSEPKVEEAGPPEGEDKGDGGEWLAERGGKPAIILSGSRKDAERFCADKGFLLLGKIVSVSGMDKAQVAKLVREMSQRDQLGRAGRQ